MIHDFFWEDLVQMLMFVNVSEMFEELQEKAKLFHAELEGYVFASQICKSKLNFVTIYWDLIFC